MLLAKTQIIPLDKSLLHDPLYKNKEGSTVAIILAYNGIIPPDIWMHDITIVNNMNQSI